MKIYVRLFSGKVGIIMDILVKIGLFGQNWTFWSKLDFLLKNDHFVKNGLIRLTYGHFAQNWTFR